jgi:hypothetical protein
MCAHAADRPLALCVVKDKLQGTDSKAIPPAMLLQGSDPRVAPPAMPLQGSITPPPFTTEYSYTPCTTGSPPCSYKRGSPEPSQRKIIWTG